MSVYKDQLIQWLREKNLKGGRVLGIGCQNDDRQYFANCDVQTYETLDFNPIHRPNMLHDMNQTRFPDGFSDEYFEVYDTVLALELWEYIWNPVAAHQNVADFLKKGGIYYGSYPFVYGIHNPPGTDYLRYTPDAVEKLCRHVGLKVLELQTRHGNNALLTFYQNDAMRIRKDVDQTITGCMVIAEKL